jgi:pimeloyl-ACP methyl ester carboxylesterase
MPTLPSSQLIALPAIGQIEYALAGHGPATVLLINGAGGPLAGWLRVFEPLSQFTRVLAYNRPGIGRSSRPHAAQTVGRMVEELRQLLQALALLDAPLILVGHSFGGLIAHLFARRHPDKVAGLLFLEATAPQDLQLLRAHETGLQRGLNWLLHKLAPLDPLHETQPEHTAASLAELLDSSAARAFPPLPLCVISGERPAMAWASKRQALALRAQHQAALARLSPRGIHLKATRSGHFPQLSEPALVIEAIQALVHQAAGVDETRGAPTLP